MMSMSGAPPVLDATGVARRFASTWVLRGASLSVEAGEVVGLLGANGSGKSTLLRVVATLLRPHAGTVRVCGHDVVKEPNAVRERIGYLAHTPGLYDDLTARENLAFAAAMLDRDARDVDALLDRVGILHAGARQVRGLSAGMQRRLALARLMLSRPRLLLLDEPYSNLDSDGIDLLNTLVAEWAESGVAALMVLHELAPAAGLLQRTVCILDGRIASSLAAEAADVAHVSRASGRP